MVRRFLTGWAVMLCCVMSLPAADNPQQARIARAEAEVRAGPSEKFPITATLHANDLVAVRRPASDGKWLEIVPPAGSFSWIEDRLVTSIDRAGVLSALGDEVPLRVGSPGFSYPLEVAEKEKVKRGAILIVRGEKIVHDKVNWWPIAPPASAARYILAEAITAPPAGASASAKPASATAAGASAEPKEWLAALNAEREKRYEDAYRIYATLAQQENKPEGNFSMVSRCNTRMRELIEQGRVKATLTALPKSDPRFAVTPAVRSGSSPIGAGTGNPAAPAPPLPALGGSYQAGMQGPPIIPAPANRGTRGYLRRSGFQIDGQTTYALEDRSGNLLLYATAAPGVDLEPHVGRPVELQGTIKARGDVRGGSHITVTQVYPLR